MTVAATPRQLRKYAIEAPITPPPQINTRIGSPQDIARAAKFQHKGSPRPAGAEHDTTV
jgi:hypothetical protein